MLKHNVTYFGTYETLINKFGFSYNEAKSLEKNYHDMYQVSDKWVEDKIEDAAKTGYATLAFGLKLKVPLLQRVTLGLKSTPYQAYSEKKTVGNALGQSYGLLNTRAVSEVMNKVRNSKYKSDILPVCQIHDASYYMIKDDPKVIEYLNNILIKAMEWQEAEEIKHDKVKITGNLSIFYPDWSKETEIPHNISKEDIKEIRDNILYNER